MSRPAATRTPPHSAGATGARNTGTTRGASTARAAGTPDALAGLELRERLALLMHEGALDPKRWREFLEGLGRRLKGAATLILRSPHVAEAGLLYSWGGSDEVLAQYAR